MRSFLQDMFSSLEELVRFTYLSKLLGDGRGILGELLSSLGIDALIELISIVFIPLKPCNSEASHREILRFKAFKFTKMFNCRSKLRIF